MGKSMHDSLSLVSNSLYHWNLISNQCPVHWIMDMCGVGGGRCLQSRLRKIQHFFKLKLQSTIYNTPSCHNSGAKEKVSGAERRRRKIREGGMKEEEVEGWIREK